MSETDYLFQLETVQANNIKSLVEALKEILTDTNIVFNEEGMKIVNVNPHKTVLVHLKLDAKKFESYTCSERIVAGVSMMNLHKIIKTVTNNDTLRFFMERNEPSKLGINIINTDKGEDTTFRYSLMDNDDPSIDIPNMEFDRFVSIPASEFQRICRNMDTISDTIEIRSMPNELILSCKCDFTDQVTVLRESEKGVIFTNGENDDIIQGFYNLSYLKQFSKCTNMCTHIQLCMKSDSLILIKFSVGSLGTLKAIIAPMANTEG